MSKSRRAIDRGCVALLLIMAPAACGKIKQSDPQAATKARAAAKRQQAACGSAVAYDRLKGLLFDQALRDNNGNGAALNALADYSFVRMDNPIVEGWDPALEVTHCKGRIILEMPAGVRRAFGGERRLQADIDYTAQVAANGDGLVYALRGAAPITTRLATFNLAGRAYQPPPAIDQRATDPDDAPPVEIAEAEMPPAPVRPVPVPSPAVVPPAPPATPRQLRPLPPTERTVPVPRPIVPVAVAQAGGEASVRAFYAALGTGDGATASAQVIPEKRASRAFSPEAISRFYGRLPEPLRLTEITAISGNAYRVRYRYSAGRSHCDGTAIVRTVSRDGETLIRSIDAQSGC